MNSSGEREIDDFVSHTVRKSLEISGMICLALEVAPKFPQNFDWLDSAEVIKIEHPTRGDDTRAWGPPYAPYSPESGREGPGESAYFLSVC